MKIKVTRIKSIIGTKANIREIMRSLKLNKINSSYVIDTDNLCMLGRLNKIKHLVKVEELV